MSAAVASPSASLEHKPAADSSSTTASAPASSSSRRATDSDNDDPDFDPSSLPVSSPSSKRGPAPTSEMSLDTIRAICRQRPDLYDNPELNDKLFLNFGSFREIKNMEHFPNLKNLWLENNLITTLGEGLVPLKQLRCLYLQNNQLTSLEGVEGLEALVLLNVSSNKLTSLKGVSKLSKLQILDVHDNAISEVDELDLMADNCKALHTIDLSQNKIEAKEEEEGGEQKEEESDRTTPARIFDQLSRLPSLKVLYLKGNPLVSQTQQYRRLLASMCPRLSFLDDRPVSELDRVCAMAWKQGGREQEKKTRAEQLEEKRAKEERNMLAWRKQKDERIAQLAALRAQEQEQEQAAEAAPSADSAASSSSSPSPPDSSYVRRVYHSTSAPIPASPYHPAIPGVEYSSWLMRQEQIEAEDVVRRAEEEEERIKEETKKKVIQEQLKKKGGEGKEADASSSSSSSASSSSSSSAPLPTSSYLSSDSSDDPEIVAMKSMLHEVLLSTQNLGSRKGGAKRSHNVGVSEAAIVEEEDEEGTEKELARREEEAAHAQSKLAELLSASHSSPSAAPAPTLAPPTTESASSSGSSTPTGDHAPNNFSILKDTTLAQIYEDIRSKLPSVETDEEEEDEEDESEGEETEAKEEEQGEAEKSAEDSAVASPSPDLVDDWGTVRSPISAKKVKSPSSGRQLPKIFGFGSDDAHLIDRPFLRAGASSAAATSTSEAGFEAAGEWEQPAEGWMPSQPAQATSSKPSTGSSTFTLSDLLEQRRAARLGQSASPSPSPPSAAPSRSQPFRPSSAHADLEQALDEGPSSRATGITAHTLLNQFIRTQQQTNNRESEEAERNHAPMKEAWGVPDRHMQPEQEQKNEIFLAASSALDYHRTHDSSDEDDSDDVASDESSDSEQAIPVDPRAAAAAARRQAREQAARRP